VSGVTLPPRIAQCYTGPVSDSSKSVKSTARLRSLGARLQNRPMPAGCEARSPRSMPMGANPQGVMCPVPTGRNHFLLRPVISVSGAWRVTPERAPRFALGRCLCPRPSPRPARYNTTQHRFCWAKGEHCDPLANVVSPEPRPSSVGARSLAFPRPALPGPCALFKSNGRPDAIGVY
jgi:hypothetical protein